MTVVMLLVVLVMGATGASAQGGHEEEEGANNLSLPVIWAEGEGSSLALPGEFGVEAFAGEAVDVDGTLWYLQGDPGNVWQAGSMAPPDDGAGGLTDVDVSTVDWGDNLEAKSWPLGQNSILRVETVLYRTLAEGTAFPPMTTYPMDDVLAFDPTPPEGAREEWATTGVEAPGTEATVYTTKARVTIQRLLVDRGDANLALLKWDAAAGKWVGENLITDTPALMTAAGAEVNASGKVIFGTNWSMAGLTDGHYRITFYLEPAADLNTFITPDTQIAVSEEEPEGPVDEVAAAAEPDQGGGVAKIDGTNNLSYIDVQLGKPTYDPYVPPTDDEAPAGQPPAGQPPAGPPPVGQEPADEPRVRKHARMTFYARDLSRHRVRFYGSVWPRHDGQKVRIQRRVGDRYKTVATANVRKATNTRSMYARTLRNAKAGLYRVVLRADEEHLTTVRTLVLQAR